MNASSEHTIPVRPRHRWVRSLILGVILLGCGIFIGSGLTLRVLWMHATASVRNPDQLPNVVTERLENILELNPEQTETVRVILKEHIQNINGIRSEIRPRIVAELMEINQEVTRELTPKQREEWQQRFDHLYKNWLQPFHDEKFNAKENDNATDP